MRICLVYDCLFPHTVGGAERWYRSLGERLAADGHEVSYLTLRQWDRGVDPGVPGVDVRAVGPRMALYSRPGPAADAAAARVRGRRSRGTCSATAVATTSSTPRRSRTSRCSPPALARRRWALPPGRRLARGLDAELLARVPRSRRRRRRLAGPAAVRPGPPARVLLLAAARRAPARGGPAGRGHDARRRVRRAARGATLARRRAARGVRRPPHPREARAGDRARDRAGARASAGTPGGDPRRRPGAPKVHALVRELGLDGVVDVPGFVADRRGRRRAGASAVHAAAVAARGLWARGDRGGSARDAERRRGRPRQRRGRAGRGRRQRRDRAVGVAGGPGGGDRAGPRRAARRCASPPPRGSPPTRSGCRSSTR